MGDLKDSLTPSTTEGLKDLEEIETTFVNEPISFKAEGLISVQLNDLQPLFFDTYGAISIFPDEVGELKVKMGDQSYIVKVVEGETKVVEGETKVVEVEEEPLDVESGSKKPAKIESVKITSTNGVIKICWQPLENSDHYIVYRLVGDNLIKLVEVDVPEYTMDAGPWNSYTFRISAVDKDGNESELSDPIGIVVIP